MEAFTHLAALLAIMTGPIIIPVALCKLAFWIGDRR